METIQPGMKPKVLVIVSSGKNDKEKALTGMM